MKQTVVITFWCLTGCLPALSFTDSDSRLSRCDCETNRPGIIIVKMLTNFLCAIALLTLARGAWSLSCLEVKKGHELKCLESDRDNYVQCVKLRMKRQQRDCEYGDECFDCDCDSCSYSQCGGDCDQCCDSCCADYVRCRSHHCCHKQCHSECRNYSCRNTCRRACYRDLEREKEAQALVEGRVLERLVQGGEQAEAKINNVQNNSNVHNITTIINLKNVLNNTNFLDVPINLTYTNKNNITLHEAQQSSESRSGGDNCCIVIGPRQCVPTQISPYIRCFHTRSRQCGSYCSSSIVHEESKQVCTSVNSFGQPTNCQQQTAYIPQPQPRCTYTSSWPYVACGIQPPAACEGCYGHYSNPQAKQFKSCPSQCYDDFSVGPLYRQGPFFQPGYSHVPPCAYGPQGCLGGFGGVGGYAGGANGMGMSPGIGGYGPFGGGYGYGAGFGGAFPPPGGFPLQQTPWYTPYLDNPFNETSSNATLFNTTIDFLEPKVINEYREGSYFVPLNRGPPKEVEIEVAVEKPDGGRAYKRGVHGRHMKEKEISVKTVF